MTPVRKYHPTAFLLFLFVTVAAGFVVDRSDVLSTVTLPLEVMGPDGYTLSVTVNVSDASGVNALYMRTHNLSYEGQGSVRINGGSWISLTDDVVTCKQPERNLECIGGAYSTIRFTLPVSGVVEGSNKVDFRHDYRVGDEASGWRVLEFNLLRNGGSEVLPQSTFMYDDPGQWAQPLPSQSDIQAGAELWNARDLLIAHPGSGAPIRAACGDCHAQDGRDLKYFNYSNRSIVVRSEFHGLTQEQGQQIASYIRSLELRREDGTPYEAPGTPWDPPYQPGPGMDEKPVERWAAGAGLDWVLEEDIEMLPYLFPDGNGGVDISPEHADVEGTLNMREMPVALQFPDWNNWLPDVHPMDYWGNQFTSGDAWRVYNDDLQDAIARGGPGGIERQLNWMTTHAKNESHDRVSGTSDEEFAAARLSMLQWQLVKTWETMHGNHLEDNAQDMNDGHFTEPHSWLGRARTAFDLAPHITAAKGLKNPPYTYGSRLQDNVYSHMWYHLQVVLNPGADPRSSSQTPVDWNYQDAFVGAYSKNTGIGAGLRYVQSWIKKTQMLHRPDLANPLYSPKGWGPNQTHPYWIMEMYETRGKKGQLFQNLSMDLRRQLLDALLQAWLDNIQQYDISEFPRGDKNDQWEPSDYVPSADAPTRLHFANMLYRDLSILDDLGVDSALLYEIALWCEEMWPRGDWENLIDLDDPPPSPNESPSVSITHPNDGAVFTAPAEITIEADAQDSDGSVTQVKFFANSTLLKSDKSAPYSLTWDISEGGKYILKAVAIDDEGESTYATVSVKVAVDEESPAPPPVSDELAYWRLDETTGTTAHDAIGTLPGTVRHGPTWKPTDGYFGGALAFDGADDRVDLGTPDVSGNAMTIALWMKARDFEQDEGRLISKAMGTSEQDHYWMVSTDDGTRLRFRLKAEGQTATLKSSRGVIEAERWHHVAVVYDGSWMRIYRDGAEVASKAKAGSIATDGSVPAALGNQPQGGRAFDGLLDDVRLYDRALSVEEITALVEGETSSPQPNEPPTVELTTPESEITLLEGAELTLTADAFDEDGTVQEVHFVVNGTMISEDASAPFQFTWQGTTAGRYVIEAQACDDDGAWRSSETITVHVEEAPDRVTEGLQVFYDFEEGQGTVVRDVSGVGTPLDLEVQDPSAVQWTAGALMVQNGTLIRSATRAQKVIEAVMASNAITIEAWIETAALDQDGPARIVTLSADGKKRNFTLGQGRWGDDPSDTYDVRLRTTDTNGSGRPSITTPQGTVKKQLQHVVYARDASGTARIYVDGVERKQATVGGSLEVWDPDYKLGLANEMTRGRPWKGTYHLVAIYGRALSASEVQQNFGVGAEPASAVTTVNTAAVLQSTAVSYGDLEGNGKIDARDAALLLQQVVRGNIVDQADVSGNGTVTAHDAWLVRQAATGALPCFAVEATCSTQPVPRAVGTVQWGQPRLEGRLVHVPVELNDVDGSVTSLQLDVPVGSAMSVVDVQVLTPADWQDAHQTRDGVFHLAMMGDTPLTAGMVATVTLELFEETGALSLGGEGFLHENEAQLLATVDVNVPTAVHLFANYPNPFNPSTQIRYQLPAQASVTLEVYNLVGQRVVTLVESEKKAGTYTVTWDGRDSTGHRVPSGTYLYRLRTGEQVQTRKMLLVK